MTETEKAIDKVIDGIVETIKKFLTVRIGYVLSKGLDIKVMIREDMEKTIEELLPKIKEDNDKLDFLKKVRKVIHQKQRECRGKILNTMFPKIVDIERELGLLMAFLYGKSTEIMEAETME